MNKLHDLQEHYSNLYKDLNGVRPPNNPSVWNSIPALEVAIDDLCDQATSMMGYDIN